MRSNSTADEVVDVGGVDDEKVSHSVAGDSEMITPQPRSLL